MLTAAQLEARRGKLTASKVGCLMRSEADKIHRLWLEMTGQEQEEDLSRIWAVRLGQATEQLQLDWFEEKNQVPVTRRGEVVVHPRHDMFAATLDGWITDPPGCPLEAKHVGGREPLEVVIERYQPQLHWQMCCTNTTQCALSVIQGASEPIVEYIDIDHAYAGELMNRGLLFMHHVKSRTPPVILPPAPPPVSQWKDYDMSENGAWEMYAGIWTQTRGAAESCEEAAKILKSLVPADAKKAYGHGARISRNRAGNLSLRMDSA